MSDYSYKLLLHHADPYTTGTVQVEVNQDHSPGDSVGNYLCFTEHKYDLSVQKVFDLAGSNLMLLTYEHPNGTYSGLQNYSPSLNFYTFCHILTTHVNVFYSDFIWESNTRWCIIVKWKENDTWF